MTVPVRLTKHGYAGKVAIRHLIEAARLWRHAGRGGYVTRPTDDEDREILEAINQWEAASRWVTDLNCQLQEMCRAYGYRHGYKTALSREQVKRLIDDKHKRERSDGSQ